MQTITDEYMQQTISTARQYCVVILKAGPKRQAPGTEKIAWEHVRRNFMLRSAGLLPIVCPVTDDSEVNGVGIFTTSVEETRKIMDEDPGVMAGIFVYEVHPCRGFPGDSLPGDSPDGAV